MKDKKYYSYILVILAGITWGTISLFLNPLLDLGFSRNQGIVLRCGCGALCLGIVMLIKDRTLFCIKLKDIWCFLGTGICSMLFMSLCYFYAIESSGACVANVLLYTSPAFVTILSLFLLKERLTINKVIAVLCVLVGVVCVSGMGTGQSMSLNGVLVGIGSGFFYSLYSIFSPYAFRRGYRSLTISFYTILFCLIGILPFSGEWSIPAGKTNIVLGCTLGLGLACAVPYICYTKGMEKVESSRAAIMVSIEPVVASIIGIVVFHEELTWLKFLGIVLVLSATIICNQRRKCSK